MVRAGVRPSLAATAISEVVLNGTGGSTLRRVFLVSTTVPVFAPATASMAASAAASDLKRSVACVAVTGVPSASKAPFTVQ